jgi:hypothetical protein
MVKISKPFCTAALAGIFVFGICFYLCSSVPFPEKVKVATRKLPAFSWQFSQPQEQVMKIQFVSGSPESSGRQENTVVHIVTVVRERRICVHCSNGWFASSDTKIENPSKVKDASCAEGEYETQQGSMFRVDEDNGRKKD